MPKFLYFLLALLLLPCAGWSQSRTGEIYTDTLWIQYVGPNEEEGFSNGYFLAVPRNLERDKKYFLLAEADPGLFKLSGGRADQTAGALGFLQAYPFLESLKTPVIMPVFTRVPSAPALRPGGLDREIMQIKEGSLKRPDLQFLAMLKDACKRLKKEGIKTYKKIWLNGFGPSGDFCTRFTFLHPKTVQAAVCGGTDGLVPLPLEEWNGHRLRYPLGTAEMKAWSGENFDFKNWKKTPQFYYMGARDKNFQLATESFLGKEEAEEALDIFGLSLTQRYNNIAALLRQSGAAVQTHLYYGKGAEPAWADAAAFFKANSGKTFAPTLPKEH